MCYLFNLNTNRNVKTTTRGVPESCCNCEVDFRSISLTKKLFQHKTFHKTEETQGKQKNYCVYFIGYSCSMSIPVCLPLHYLHTCMRRAPKVSLNSSIFSFCLVIWETTTKRVVWPQPWKADWKYVGNSVNHQQRNHRVKSTSLTVLNKNWA